MMLRWNMDKVHLQEVLDQTKNLKQNEYPLSLPLDFIELVKSSLTELDLSFEEKFENNRKNIYIYRQNQLISKYFKGKYPNNTFLSRRISNDKFLTEYYLKLNDVPMPSSKIFKGDEVGDAIKFAKKLESPFVVKALNLLGGAGIYTDVNSSNFRKFWDACIRVQKKYYPKGSPKVLIQQQIEGLEIRVNVSEGIFQSAILRLPGYLIGDGASSVEDLIRVKNKERSRNPYLNKHQIKLTDELKENISNQGRSLTDILKKGEVFLLTKQPALRFGGEVINVTGLLSPDILELGLSAVRAIPGLHTGGVDIIIPHLKSHTGHVIEVNKNPAFQMCIYTDKGKPHNPITEVYKSHILDHKILNEEIECTDDINDEEMKQIVQRYKYLLEKDKVNSKIINDFHKSKFDKK